LHCVAVCRLSVSFGSRSTAVSIVEKKVLGPPIKTWKTRGCEAILGVFGNTLRCLSYSYLANIPNKQNFLNNLNFTGDQ
jgi:hypothetical protein